MKISIDELRNLPQGRLNISFREEIEGLAAVKPVLGELTVSASAAGMRLTGSVQTLLKLTCHRCLRPYFLSLSVPIEEDFVESDIGNEFELPRERELLARDFTEPLSEDGVLDITDVVYQAVTLATPVSCFCGESCPGPAFPGGEAESGSLAGGKDASEGATRIDPRWKNLKTLFPKEETD